MPKDKTPQTLTAPETIPLGSKVTVTGAGFEPWQTVLLDGGHAAPMVDADANGGLVHEMGYVYTGPGNAAVRALILQRREWVEVARASFEVVEG